MFGNPKKNNSNPFYPFLEVSFNFHETRICPFCGKELKTSSYNCDCQKFKEAFKKMQESSMDLEHESELHTDRFNITLNSYKTSAVSYKLLDEQEVSALGPDFWDNADRKRSAFKTLLLSKGSYDGEKVTFYLKDCESKKIYFCECKDCFDQSHKEISLGTYYRNFVPNPFGNPNALGNYHEECGYNDIRRFSGWDQVCKELQTFWFLLRTTNVLPYRWDIFIFPLLGRERAFISIINRIFYIVLFDFL